VAPLHEHSDGAADGNSASCCDRSSPCVVIRDYKRGLPSPASARAQPSAPRRERGHPA
jgi:hypothetical protein